jgi:hypothetical protein
MIRGCHGNVSFLFGPGNPHAQLRNQELPLLVPHAEAIRHNCPHAHSGALCRCPNAALIRAVGVHRRGEEAGGEAALDAGLLSGAATGAGRVR